MTQLLNADRLRKPASTGRTSAEGRERYVIYRNVWEQVTHAQNSQCWLEVITLAESVIADRLEARIAHICGQDSTARKVSTASKGAQRLRSLEVAVDESVLATYRRVEIWSRGRNRALHELAKLLETTSVDWPQRYQDTRQVANEGISLAKEVSRMIRRLNKKSG